MKKEFTISELGKAVNVSRRTIRYYISRDLMPPPKMAGRNAVYGIEHLERLKEIGRLKEQGLTLHEIGLGLRGGYAEEIRSYQAEVFEIARDVKVEVVGHVAPWRMNKIKKVLARAAEEL
jgi:DNA-binding transcriptional MerR regulator